MPRTENPQEVELVAEPLTLKELAEVLVKHHGLHEGMYDVSFSMQIGVGPVGPDKDSRVPGVSIGLQRIGLARAKEIGPGTVDASKVNPKRSRKVAKV